MVQRLLVWSLISSALVNLEVIADDVCSLLQPLAPATPILLEDLDIEDTNFPVDIAEVSGCVYRCYIGSFCSKTMDDTKVEACRSHSFLQGFWKWRRGKNSELLNFQKKFKDDGQDYQAFSVAILAANSACDNMNRRISNLNAEIALWDTYKASVHDTHRATGLRFTPTYDKMHASEHKAQLARRSLVAESPLCAKAFEAAKAALVLGPFWVQFFTALPDPLRVADDVASLMQAVAPATAILLQEIDIEDAKEELEIEDAEDLDIEDTDGGPTIDGMSTAIKANSSRAISFVQGFMTWKGGKDRLLKKFQKKFKEDQAVSVALAAANSACANLSESARKAWAGASVARDSLVAAWPPCVNAFDDAKAALALGPFWAQFFAALPEPPRVAVKQR